MDFEKHEKHRENRYPRGAIVPPRRSAPTRFSRRGVESTAPSAAPKPEPPTVPADLARVRKDMGFDDIPTDQSDDRRLREVLGAWIVHTFQLTHPDNKVRRIYRFFHDKHYASWKEDLKWALQADTDDIDKPSTRPDTKSGSAQHTASTAQAPLPSQHPSQIPVSTSASKSIEINVNFGSLPKLPPLPKVTSARKLFEKVRQFEWTRTRIVLAALLLVTVCGVVAWRAVPGLPGKTTAGNGITASRVHETPAYSTLSPNSTSIDALGGWHRVSPPGKEAVFAYADKLDNVPINVSQQPIPESFQHDSASSVQKLAKEFGATQRITAGDTVLYIATFPKGIQSVIFTKNDTLIMIKSQGKVDEKSWASYAESLH